MPRYITLLFILLILSACSKNINEANLGNIALNKPVTASGELLPHHPVLAVDGDPDTGWQTTGSPIWISIDLIECYTISKIQLITNQPESGQSCHEIQLMSKGEVQHKIILEGETHQYQVLQVTCNAIPEIDQVKIQTNYSPGWAGWNEIRIYQ